MVAIVALTASGAGACGGGAVSAGSAASVVSPDRGALLAIAPGCRRSCVGAAGVESPPSSSKAANGLDGRAGSAAAARLRAVRSWFDGTLGGNATLGTGNLGSLDPAVALQSAGHPPCVPNLRDINGLAKDCGPPGREPPGQRLRAGGKNCRGGQGGAVPERCGRAVGRSNAYNRESVPAARA